MALDRLAAGDQDAFLRLSGSPEREQLIAADRSGPAPMLDKRG
jgi:hypothetical protein